MLNEPCVYSVNWLLPSEIFPPAKRAKAVGISIGTNWLSNVNPILPAPLLFGSSR